MKSMARWQVVKYRARVYVVLLVLLAAGACSDGAPAEAPGRSEVVHQYQRVLQDRFIQMRTMAVFEAPEAQPPPAPQSLRPPTIGSTLVGEAEGQECIRGGTPRADVRSIMGEPDSISFGVWFYGASEVAFGYGVVVEYRDVDGNLILCR